MNERAEKGAFEILIHPACLRAIMDQEGLTYRDVTDFANGEIDVTTVWATATGANEPKHTTLQVITGAIAEALGYETDELTELLQ